MKKIIIFCSIGLFVTVFAFSQSAVTLDMALNNSTVYLNGRIPAGTKVVVLNFTSNWPELSEYVIEELIGYIVNEETLTVVDRRNLETIRNEMNFQFSGEVSDETAQSIGKILGAQTIISGSITAIGSAYRLRVRAISVETAQILGMQNIDVAQDSRLAALTGTAYVGPASTNNNTNRNTTNVTAVLPTAGWHINSDPNSTARIYTNREYIDGQERDLLTVEVNIARGNENYAGIYLVNQTIIQKLKEGSGVRLKILGDGKRWRFGLSMRETDPDGSYHDITITTRNGRVMEIDIPFTRLRQPEWAKKVAFNKSNIWAIKLEKNNTHGSEASSIKIFDFEIY